MLKSRLFKGAVALTVFDNLQHLSMADVILLHGLIVFKYVVFHLVVSSFIGIIIFVHSTVSSFCFRIFNSLTNQGIDYIFLFVSKCVKYIGYGLFRLVGVDFLGFFRHFGLILLFVSISVAKRQQFVIVNYSFFIAHFTVNHDGVDIRSGIGSGKNQRYLANNTVHHVTLILFKLISINRQGLDVAMLYEEFCVLGIFRIVERTIRINAVLTILKEGVTKNVVGVVVVVVPHQRYCFTVVICKSVLHDGATVRTTTIRSGCPATKIVFSHFEFPPC